MKNKQSFCIVFFSMTLSFSNVAFFNGLFYELTEWFCNHLHEYFHIFNKNYEFSTLRWLVYYGYGIILTPPTFFILKRVIKTIDKIKHSTKSNIIIILTKIVYWITIYYISFSIVSFLIFIIDDLFSLEVLAHHSYKYTHDNLGWYTSETYDFDPFFADLLLFTFIAFPLISCYFTSKSIKKYIKGTDYPSGSGYDL